jgi:hypothetical protein
MKALLFAVVLMLWPQDKAMVYLPADRAMPQTLVVAAKVPDSALICMEPPTGTVVCRTVGTFREWIQASTVNRMKK